MKNLFQKTIFLCLFLAVSIARGQSPIIEDFRNIIKNIPANFDVLKKEMTEENKDKNYKLFTTTLADLPICDNFIFESPVEGTFLVLSYKVKNMDVMMMKIFNTMVPQYMNEINEMIKTGNYKGEDFEENGKSITEVTDLNGKIILQYRSNSEEHRIMFYGSKK